MWPNKATVPSSFTVDSILIFSYYLVRSLMHTRRESTSISLYFLLCTETKYVQFLSNEVYYSMINFHHTFLCTLNSHDAGVTAKSLCNSGSCTNVMFIRPTTVKVTKCYDFYQCITIWCFPRTCWCQICKMWGWTNKIADWLLNLFFEKLHIRDDFTAKFYRTFCKLEYRTYLESAERSHTNQKKCSTVAKVGDRLATIDRGQKLGGVPFFGGWVPIYHNVAWAEAYLHTKWHLDPFSHLATIDMGRKMKDCAPFWGGELNPCLTKCCLGRGLPSYQVASRSIQPFGHNRYGQKIGGCAPLS